MSVKLAVRRNGRYDKLGGVVSRACNDGAARITVLVDVVFNRFGNLVQIPAALAAVCNDFVVAAAENHSSVRLP